MLSAGDTRSTKQGLGSRAASRAGDEGRVPVSAYPRAVTFALEGRCNARCLFCLDHGPLNAHQSFTPVTALPDAVLNEVLPHVTTVDWSHVHECLLSRRFLSLLGDASPAPSVILLTNGLLLARWRDTLLDSPKPMEIGVSLHATTAATHSLVLGCGEDEFDEIVETLRTMVRRRDEEGLPKRFTLVFVVIHANVHELADFVRLGVDIGVDTIRIKSLQWGPAHGWSVERAGYRFNYQEEMAHRFQDEIDAQLGEAGRFLRKAGVDPGRLQVELSEPPPPVFRALAAALATPPLAAAARMATGRGVPVRLGPLLRRGGAAVSALRLRCLSHQRGTFRCRRPWETAIVNDTGDLRFCLNSSLYLGNVNERPFGELWNGERAQRLRRVAASGRIPACCVGCPHATARDRQRP